MTEPLRLTVRVDRSPDPHLLRAALEDALAGRPGVGPEAEVGRAVSQAVLGDAGGERPWR